MAWPEYQHIAARAFNQPLMIEPAYARVFFSALGERFGADRLVDAVSGQALAGDEMKLLASSWTDKERRPRTYRVEQGIAILPITGTLAHRLGYIQPVSGITGYDGIAKRLQQAAEDPDVKGILLDIDSPGGEVAGCYDTADLIARAREKKPVWALANDMACSGGYMLAAACTRRLITQTSIVGSIGVLVAHRSVAKALEKAGVDVTLVYSGNHKVDGNPYEKLPAEVRGTIQAEIDKIRGQFVKKVAAFTGMAEAHVFATEAATYTGEEAVKAGLADQIVNYADAVDVMAEAIKMKTTNSGGVTMSTIAPAANAETTPTVTTAAAPENNPDVVAATEPTTEQIRAQAASDEMSRIMGIINCPEAKGREEQAKALAAIPGMTAEQAKKVLAVAPQAAQVRTETALDTLMETESPAVIQDGNKALATGASAKISLLVAAGESIEGGN
ncbi:S49 family peptidase [Salmonella enterica subsp. salamae]|nr:S49 family peptidase [Salmonella enterica subsp. salamae]HAV0413613.1 S49 family peptidase [Salmonella enterica]